MRVDVIYAAHIKPGDLYAGRVDKNAPTRVVQPIARAIPVDRVETGFLDGQKVVRVNPIAGLARELTPIPYSMQVLVIRSDL